MFWKIFSPTHPPKNYISYAFSTFTCILRYLAFHYQVEKLYSGVAATVIDYGQRKLYWDKDFNKNLKSTGDIYFFFCPYN